MLYALGELMILNMISARELLDFLKTFQSEREEELKQAEDNLKREIDLNIELAKRYKILQAQQIATKDALAGFYESRVALEDTKVWFNRIINMENRYFDKTTEYYILRDKAHK